MIKPVKVLIEPHGVVLNDGNNHDCNRNNSNHISSRSSFKIITIAILIIHSNDNSNDNTNNNV